MSLLRASAPYRRDQPTQLRVPVVLPLVQVRIDADGQLDIIVDHVSYDTGAALTRSDLHRVLDTIAGDLASPVKVEIREPDDSIFTDIITPGRQQDPQPGPQYTAQPQQTAWASLSSSLGEIAGGGFLPNEEVAVAVVVAHQVASPDGTARLRLPAALLAGRPGIVVLMGQTSGAITVSAGVSGGVA